MKLNLRVLVGASLAGAGFAFASCLIPIAEPVPAVDAGPPPNEERTPRVFFFAKAGRNPRSIVATAEYVAWVNEERGEPVQICPGIPPCDSPTSIPEPTGAAKGLALLGGRIFWAVPQGNKVGSTTLPPVEDAGYATSVSSGPAWLTSSDSHLYGTRTVVTSVFSMSMPLGSGVVSHDLRHDAGLVVARDLVVGGRTLFLSGNEGTTIYRVRLPLALGEDAVVIARDQVVTSIQADENDVFWTSSVRGTVYRVPALPPPPEGHTPSLVAGELLGATGMALDPSWLYVAVAGVRSDDGRVVKISRTDGAMIVVADGQPKPWGVALGGGYVYWTNAGDNTVMAAPR